MIKAKSDCAATYVPGGQALTVTVTVESSVAVLFGRAVESAARAAAAELGVKTGALSIDDDGALDFVVAARVESALREAGVSSPIGASRESGAARASAGAPHTSAAAVQADGEGRRTRRRWSRMYVPGNQPDLLPNAGLFGADCLVLDLEDSVSPAKKLEARILLRRVLQAHRDFFRASEVVVRINPLSGAWGRDDMAELSGCLPDAILLPKCESASEVAALDGLLSGYELAAGIEAGRTLVMPLIETAKGVLAAAAIASASPRVAAVCFGAEDFTKDIGVRRTAAGTESALARQSIVLAAKASSVQVQDSVFSDVDDSSGFCAYCAASSALGFDGVGLVHPRQIALAHEAFRPSGADIDEARAIVAALAEAEAKGSGVASLNGKMIDAPVAERSRRVLARYAHEAATRPAGGKVP